MKRSLTLIHSLASVDHGNPCLDQSILMPETTRTVHDGRLDESHLCALPAFSNTLNKFSRVVGQAAEHYVMFDLMTSGIFASKSPDGCPYDIAADIGSKIIKVQVKSALKASDRDGAYRFKTYHREMKGKIRTDIPYTDDQVDLFAFVAIDQRVVAYVPFDRIFSTTAVFSTRRRVFLRKDIRRKFVEDYPLQEALAALTKRSA